MLVYTDIIKQAIQCLFLHDCGRGVYRNWISSLWRKRVNAYVLNLACFETVSLIVTYYRSDLCSSGHNFFFFKHTVMSSRFVSRIHQNNLERLIMEGPRELTVDLL